MPGSDDSLSKNTVTSAQISWTIISVTALVATYLYRESIYTGFEQLASMLNPDVTMASLAICTVLLIVFIIRQWRSNKKIALEVANREKQIIFHRDRHEEITKSQQKYKALFEDAMNAAYQDLEKLNADLQEKQAKLASEIEGHRKTDSALKESELRWMKLVEKNPEAIVISVGSVIAYANPAGLAILGVADLDEIRGVEFAQFLPDDVKGDVARMISEETEQREFLEFEIRGRDGKARIVELHAVPAVFRGKQASQNVLRDVTQKKESERAVRRYTEQLRAMVDIERLMLLAGDVSTIADETFSKLEHLVPFDIGVLVEYNEVTGEVSVHASKGIQNPHREAKLSPLHGRNWIWSSEFFSNEGDMSLAHSEFDQWIIQLGAEEYLYLPLAARDETLGAIILGRFRKAFTTEAIDMVRELADLLALGINQARIMAERQSYEAELLSAKERAEELVQLKTTFLTNMSHEIRTPLSGIIGFAQILKEEIGVEHMEFVELIESSGKRLLDTINSVLDLARLESGNLDMETDPIDASKVVWAATAMLQSLAIKKGIKLETEGAGRAIMAEIDKSGLDRVVNNLVGNAIKFTDSGKVTVRLATDNDQLLLEVEDTGVGISDQFLPHIFDDFKQESRGPARSHEGSGMGLSITRKLVEVMSGKIEVKSEKSVGSLFRVSFPLKSARKAIHNGRSSADRAPARPTSAPIHRRHNRPTQHVSYWDE